MPLTPNQAGTGAQDDRGRWRKQTGGLGQFACAGSYAEVVTPGWDAILVVEYPSPAAFIDMVTNEEFAKVHQYREDALDRGDLIATSIWSPR